MKNIIKVSQIQEGIMKKKISLLLIAMLSLTSLAACGEKADAETPQEGGGGDRHQRKLSWKALSERNGVHLRGLSHFNQDEKSGASSSEGSAENI